jgi:hypothetical protein
MCVCVMCVMCVMCVCVCVMCVCVCVCVCVWIQVLVDVQEAAEGFQVLASDDMGDLVRRVIDVCGAMTQRQVISVMVLLGTMNMMFASLYPSTPLSLSPCR